MAYQAALRHGGSDKARANLSLTDSLLVQAKKDGEAKAMGTLFEALNAQGRQYEAMGFGKGLGDFWKDRKKDASALPELVKRLEAKLLPVPGTEVLMSKTEFTVGEWKLYLRAEGLPDWQQPSKEWTQTDEHPVVNVNWNQVMKFCKWLSGVTGKEWRLPTNAEWDATVGSSTYPWGDYFPPKWDDGNYRIMVDGTDDPKNIGVDGILGTAPVGSFKPNALGFYDLGGNVCEWMLDGFSADDPNTIRIVRGATWERNPYGVRSADRGVSRAHWASTSHGFRIALGRP